MSFTAFRHYLHTNPRYLYALIRQKIRLRKRFGWINRNVKTGKRVPPPLVYKITLSSACNLTCKRCMNITDHDNPKHTADYDDIDYSLFKEVIDQFGRTNPSVILSGGEPMLHCRFRDIITLLEKRSIATHICTNGTVLEKHIPLLATMKHISLIVSVDGIKDVNDTVRGYGMYDKVVSGIRQLRKENRSIYIGIQHTIQPENVASMYRFCKEMVALKVDWILLNPCWHISREQADGYSAFMKKEFSITAHGHEGYIMDYPVNFDQFTQQYTRIRSSQWPIQISCYYNNPVDDMRNMLTDATYFCGNRFCYKQWIRMDIMPDGTVVSCQQFPDVILGDLHRSTGEDIWNGKPFREFRNTLLRGPLPVCNKCAPIYLYNGSRNAL